MSEKKKSPPLVGSAILLSLWFLLLVGSLLVLEYSLTPPEGKTSSQRNEVALRQSQALTKVLARRAQDGLIRSDEEERILALGKFVSDTKEDLPELHYFVIIDDSNKIWGHFDQAKVGAVYQLPKGKVIQTNILEIETPEKGKIYDISAPIMLRNKYIGYVHLGLPIDKSITSTKPMLPPKERYYFYAGVLLLGIIGSFGGVILVGKKAKKWTFQTLDTETQGKITAAQRELLDLERMKNEAIKEFRQYNSNIALQHEEIKRNKKDLSEVAERVNNMKREEIELSKKLEGMRRLVVATMEQKLGAPTSEETAPKEDVAALRQGIDAAKRALLDLDCRIEARRKEEIELQRRIEEQKAKIQSTPDKKSQISTV
ncbi:MAG: hypothetical protein AB1393_02815 [Candidatus Edwardsbacteria bacterium]